MSQLGYSEEKNTSDNRLSKRSTHMKNRSSKAEGDRKTLLPQYEFVCIVLDRPETRRRVSKDIMTDKQGRG